MYQVRVDNSFDQLPPSLLRFLTSAHEGLRSDKNRLIKRANDVIRDFQVFKMHKRSAPIFVNQFPVHVLNDMYTSRHC